MHSAWRAYIVCHFYHPLYPPKLSIIWDQNIDLNILESRWYLVTWITAKIEEITTDLYIFAEKYDIPCLLKFCSQILGNNLNNNNVIDIVKAANTAEDDVLLKKAAKFLNKNPSIIHDNLPFQTYLKENCSKLFTFMILRE